MKLAYWDCSAGIAGDMCLGSLLACGVPLDYLIKHLAALGLVGEFDLTAESVLRAGQAATQAIVELTPHPAHRHQGHNPHPEDHHRHWSDIRVLLEQAPLPPRAKANSLKVFGHLATAEATVHRMPVEQVHFHEVGAVDALVDVVGTCLGMDWLGVEKVLCSPHPIGGGWVHVAHGQLAVPVPAVVQLWETFQVPIYSNGIEAELVTPTGAAIAVTLASEFGPCPAMKVLSVGCGAGGRDLTIPNVLRLWVGESTGLPLTEEVVVLETQIDDLNPQIIGYTAEQLLAAGALDVFTQAVTMKQNRPGTLLTVVCPSHLAVVCQDLLFRETSTLGIRSQRQQRTVLERSFTPVITQYGSITMKVARQYGQIVNVQPEFRDCVARAQDLGIPVQTVWLAAQQAWQQENPS